jgi:hypothetical protein
MITIWARAFMDLHQEQFLKDELLSLTLMATVQRADVYTHGSPEKKRKAFQKALRSCLEELARSYYQQVSEETHVQNIVGLSNGLSSIHGSVLRNRRFRIGAAQKALNLYLKYLWCLGMISAPPHCPFDSRIIGRLSEYIGPRWTALDSENDYRALMNAAKAAANGLSLAAWELQTYNNSQPGSPPRAGKGRS